MSTRCFHGTCTDCRKRLEGKPCYYCRDPPQGAEFKRLPSEDYHNIVLNENRPEVRAFDILFGSKHRCTYEVIRDMLRTKWSSVADNDFSKVCRVCMLKQRHPEVDITLLALFYACSTITQTTILDAMTSLCMLYGLRVCAKVAPKDVFFHFFLNHCTTERAADEDDQSEVSDFVIKVMHALTNDVPEIDTMASFISILPSDALAQCKCNAAQKSLETISGKRLTTPEKEEDCGISPFVPEGYESKGDRVGWDNTYKWSSSRESRDNRDDGPDDEDATRVNCLGIFTDCSICDMMMDREAYPDLKDMDERVEARRKYMHVETAVTVVCTEKRRTDILTDMIRHYTNSQCELNRLKFIFFYSLIKQPSSLTSGPAALHLFNELFSSKLSYLCPTYHLACFSDCIVGADSSQFKKTKRESIQRWTAKIIRRHAGARGSSIRVFKGRIA